MQAFIPFIILGGAILILLVWIIVLELRLKRLFRGEKPVSIETLLSKNQKDISDLVSEHSSLENKIADLNRRMQTKITTARILRFNPFQGTGSGGNQSFAAALLDEKGDGVVLSSLYSREKVSIFAKPVVGRNSEYELTEEERAVLK